MRVSYREDIAVPFPESNEVLIKVEACGVNNTDIWTRLGSYVMIQINQDGEGEHFTFHVFKVQTSWAV
jgi:NADPH:quinone reductase-like Zn-dependent oxidoreductase